MGQEAVCLEKALGLQGQVDQRPNNGPLLLVENQLSSLLGSYQDLKKELLVEYFDLQKKGNFSLFVFGYEKA